MEPVQTVDFAATHLVARLPHPEDQTGSDDFAMLLSGLAETTVAPADGPAAAAEVQPPAMTFLMPPLPVDGVDAAGTDASEQVSVGGDGSPAPATSADSSDLISVPATQETAVRMPDMPASFRAPWTPDAAATVLRRTGLATPGSVPPAASAAGPVQSDLAPSPAAVASRGPASAPPEDAELRDRQPLATPAASGFAPVAQTFHAGIADHGRAAAALGHAASATPALTPFRAGDPEVEPGATRSAPGTPGRAVAIAAATRSEEMAAADGRADTTPAEIHARNDARRSQADGAVGTAAASTASAGQIAPVPGLHPGATADPVPPAVPNPAADAPPISAAAGGRALPSEVVSGGSSPLQHPDHAKAPLARADVVPSDHAQADDAQADDAPADLARGQIAQGQLAPVEPTVAGPMLTDLAFAGAPPGAIVNARISLHATGDSAANGSAIDPGQLSDIGKTLAVSLARTPDQPVEVTLSPEELGKVRMTLTGSDGALALNLVAERPETLDLMRRHIDSLAQDFRDLGFGEVTFTFGRERGENRHPEAAPIPDIPHDTAAGAPDGAPQLLIRRPESPAAGQGLDLRL